MAFVGVIWNSRVAARRCGRDRALPLMRLVAPATFVDRVVLAARELEARHSGELVGDVHVRSRFVRA